MEPPTPSVTVDVERVLVFVGLIPTECRLEVNQVFDDVTAAVILAALSFVTSECKVDVTRHQSRRRHIALDHRVVTGIGSRLIESDPPVSRFILAHKPDSHPLTRAPPCSSIEPHAGGSPSPNRLVVGFLVPLGVPNLMVPELLQWRQEDVRVHGRLRKGEERSQN